MSHLNRNGLFDRVWKEVLCQDVCKWLHTYACAQRCHKIWWTFLGRYSQLREEGGGSQSRANRGISLSFTEFYWFMRSIVLWLWHMCWSCWTLFPALSQTSDAVTHKSFGVSVPQLSVPSGSWRSFDSTSEVQTGGCGMNEGNELIAIMATLSGLLY